METKDNIEVNVEATQATLPEIEAVPCECEVVESEFVPNLGKTPPADASVSEVDFSTHIPSANQTATEEEKENEMAVKVDLSQVVFDKDNIPEITRDDLFKIKTSGFYTSEDFHLEIEAAREEVFRCRMELSEEYQKKIEEEAIEDIDDAKEDIKELMDPEEIRSKEIFIEYCQAIIDALPKNNAEQKENLEKAEKRAIELIASYQLVSRKDIDDLIKNGSIVTLISQRSVNTLLNIYYEHFARINNIEDSPEKKRLLEEREAVYKEFSKVHGAIEVYESVTESEGEDENGKPLPNKLSQMSETEKNEFFRIFKTNFGFNFNDGIEKLKKDEETLDENFKQLTSLILKETNTGIWEKERQDLQKVGLTVTLMRLAKMVEPTLPGLTRNDSVLDKIYIESLNDRIYELINILVKKDFENEFNFTKSNINNITIFPNNLIHYIELLINDEVTDEWKNNFDEHDQISAVFKSHEEELKTLFEKYNEARRLLYNNLINNNNLLDTLDNLAYALYQENERIVKTSKKSKIKQYYKRHLKSAFNYQIITGVKSLIEQREKLFTQNEGDNFKADFSPIISTILHNTIGCKIARLFVDFNRHMKDELGSNLHTFCTEHLFHEYVLSQWAIKVTKPDQTALEMFKDKTKNIIFQSADLFFIENVNIQSTRYEFMKETLIWATEILNNICEAYPYEEENEKPKETE